MRRLGQLALALIAVAVVIGSAPNTSAQKLLSMTPEPKKCITIGKKRICLEDFEKKKDEDDNVDDDDKPKKTGNICEGEIACPPGYVVLDKPNQYGACCEPKEGFPCPPDRPVGNRPNCCPQGTQPPNCTPVVQWLEFVRDLYGTNISPEALAKPFQDECATYKKSYANCAIITASPNTHVKCACHYQK